MNFIRNLASKILVIAAAAFAASTCLASSDDYPNKPIKIVVPYPPGGTSDSVARIVANGLTQKFGKPVIVDNRGGAGTVLGTQVVTSSEPDGYTLLLTSTPLAINETLYATLPYRVFKDIVPVSVVASVPLVMIVNPSSKAKTVADLVQMAKDRPGQLTYGSSGNGGSPHLSMEMFQAATGTKFVHVPYKGSAPAVMDLVAGQTDVVVDTTLTTQPQVAAGKARALAQLGAQRSKLMPDVPTLQESGLAGYDVSSWFVLAAPGKTPPALISKLNAAVSELIASDAVRETFAKQGLEAVGGDVAATNHFVKQQIERFGAAVKNAGVKVD